MLKFYKNNNALSVSTEKGRRTRTFVAGMVVFLITLQSFYAANIGVAPFPLLGVVGMIMFVIVIPRPKKYSTFFVSPTALAVSYVIGFLLSVLCIFFYGDEIDPKRILGFALAVLVAAVTPHFVRRINLRSVLNFVLTLHIVFFLLQFVLFYVFNFDLNYISLLFPAETKGSGGGFSHEVLGDFRRMGGLYNEPGTYAAFVSPLIALKARDYDFGGYDKWIVNIAALTVVLTFSTFGIVFSTVIVGCLWAVYGIRRSLGVVIIAGIGALIAVPYFVFRFVTRVASGEESGAEFRFKFASDVFEYVTSGVSPMLVGAGLLSSELANKIEVIAAVNDNGLYLYLILTVGPIFAASFCWVILKNCLRAGFFSAVAAGILLVSKASLFWLFVPFIFTCLLVHSTVVKQQ